VEPFPSSGYRQLAEFRYQVRKFLHFSEEAARAHGIEPQQHQLMLVIKGLPPETRPTVTALSARLCLKHHSTVELVSRLVERGAAVRRASEEDRREVLVELTPMGENMLEQLSVEHWRELQSAGPELSQVLGALVHRDSEADAPRHSA
jgi:DNA-binding MarR family transcriptional regulator